jgi:hypothetical protein
MFVKATTIETTKNKGTKAVNVKNHNFVNVCNACKTKGHPRNNCAKL